MFCTYYFITAFIKIKRFAIHWKYIIYYGSFKWWLGGVFLILLASFIYPLWIYFNGYFVGICCIYICLYDWVIHYMVILKNPSSRIVLTNITVIRVFASSMFFALYISQNWFEALFICLFDLAFYLFNLFYVRRVYAKIDFNFFYSACELCYHFY